jgi:chromosome segregation ATPase
MTPEQFLLSRRRVGAFALLAGMASAAGFSADQPRPTPRPGTLGAYAREVTLDRSALGQASGRVIVTNDTVIGVCEGASITLGAVTMDGLDAPTATRGDSAERTRWRAAHRRQQRVIADLEERMSVLEIEIHHIEDQRLTPKILARLDRAEAKRRHLEHEIRRARDELARIVRDARRHGAEPGWFR